MLECLVFGRRAALASASEPVLAPGLEPSSRPAPPAPVTAELRTAMWRDAGLVRDGSGLERLAEASHPVARLVARSALARAESRGGHFRVDFPHEDSELRGMHTVLRPGLEAVFESWN
jgi:L-aspartate oxidase